MIGVLVEPRHGVQRVGGGVLHHGAMSDDVFERDAVVGSDATVRQGALVEQLHDVGPRHAEELRGLPWCDLRVVGRDGDGVALCEMLEGARRRRKCLVRYFHAAAIRLDEHPGVMVVRLGQLAEGGAAAADSASSGNCMPPSRSLSMFAPASDAAVTACRADILCESEARSPLVPSWSHCSSHRR